MTCNINNKYECNLNIKKTYLLVGVGLAWATQGITTVSFRRADMYTSFSFIIGGMVPRISAKNTTRNA